MAFTVRDYQDLLSLLNAHPEWREELRRAIFNDDFLSLPQIVRELAAAQKRTEEQVRELAAAQQRTEEQVRELAAAQQRTEEQVRELAAAQQRTEEQVRELAAAQKRTEERLDRVETRLDGVETRLDRVEVELGKTRSELGRLSSMLGASLEDEAGSVTATVMRQKGYRVLQEASALRFNGDVDVLLPVEDAQGRRLWVLVEAKTRLSRKDVLRWVQRVRSTRWRKALEKAGCEPPYLVYVYAIRSDLSAREAVEENGIGLMRGEGEVVAPAGEME
jgi:hypothetical protein